MANKQITLKLDVTPPTIKFDLVPTIRAMEQSYADLEVFKGDKVTINFTITQNGTAFDLTEYTVKFQAKQAIGDMSFVFDKTATKTDATGGKCQVVLDGADIDEAESLTAQLYATVSGTTQTLFQFPLIVLGSV